MSQSESRRFVFHDFAPTSVSFREEVVRGLSRPRKAIAAKFFYDKEGSRLFEAICEQPEYYPTRVETSIMQRYSGEMAELIGPDCLLIEYGSGASRKTRFLLDAARPAAYVPIDISRAQLLQSAQELSAAYPALNIVAICADYLQPLPLPDCSMYRFRRKVVYFPGSTIGNLERGETVEFLRNVREVIGRDGAFLVGVDLKKSPALLHAAYNDAAGVTAAFNLNLLSRMNRELGADFDIAAFRHHAFFAPVAGRVEMHLLSLKPQFAHIGELAVEFRAGETIHTEISRKYGDEEFHELAAEVGFVPLKVWIDDAQLFSLHLLSLAA